ncbi:MAG: PqqD family protein, partial [Betaproteobacteria bacterium]
VGEIIDGEVMVINLKTGVYYSITGAGALAWPMLIAGVTPREIGAGLARQYGVDVATVGHDVDAFIGRLAGEGILRARHTAADAFEPVAEPPPTAYPGFGFERFDDMRALLVIDPVHEVGDFGWPPRVADGGNDR